MKLRSKVIITLFLGGIIIAYGSYRIYMIKIVMDNSTEVKKFVYDADKYHRVKSVTINYFSVQHNPMGGINMSGYVNEDKKNGF